MTKARALRSGPVSEHVRHEKDSHSELFVAVVVEEEDVASCVFDCGSGGAVATTGISTCKPSGVGRQEKEDCESSTRDCNSMRGREVECSKRTCRSNLPHGVQDSWFVEEEEEAEVASSIGVDFLSLERLEFLPCCKGRLLVVSVVVLVILGMNSLSIIQRVTDGRGSRLLATDTAPPLVLLSMKWKKGFF
jgi:hypothetical protein